MNKRLLGFAFTALLVFGAAALGGWYYVETNVRGTAHVDGSGGYDSSDRRNVAGIAELIFVGDVEKQVGDQGLPLSGPGDETIPMRQYSVRVVQALKGSPSDTVV